MVYVIGFFKIFNVSIKKIINLRDLKPNNILVSEDGEEVKITDFNVSKFSDNYKKSLSLKNNIKMMTYTGNFLILKK